MRNSPLSISKSRLNNSSYTRKSLPYRVAVCVKRTFIAIASVVFIGFSIADNLAMFARQNSALCHPRYPLTGRGIHRSRARARAHTIHLVTQFNLHPLLELSHALFTVLSIWSLLQHPLSLSSANERTTFPVTRGANSFAHKYSHPAAVIDVKSLFARLCRTRRGLMLPRKISRQRSVEKKRKSIPLIQKRSVI